MSSTAIAWALIAAVLCLLSLKRPVWAFAFYAQTFFAAPQLWWWGRDVPQTRWALWAGCLLLVATTLQSLRSERTATDQRTFSHAVGVWMIANATVVHLLLALNRGVSLDTYIELLKYTLIFHLIWKSIRDRRDFGVALVAIALGGLYIGWEVTINERGDFTGSRLEGVGAPGADAANSLANMLLLFLPIMASLLVYGNRKHIAVAVAASPLVLNVILLCNSRGNFLGLITSGIVFVLLARGQTRKKALGAVSVGAVALLLLLGDPKIMDRFSTTFVGSEERDASAAGRVEFWRAALMQLADYPLGAGGGSFKFTIGRSYLVRIVGEDNAESRSIHNGYLTEATDWGVQGLILKMTFIFAGVAAAFRTAERCRREGRVNDAIMGLCLLTGMAGYFVSTVFGSFLANEWVYWVVALMFRYSQFYATAEAVAAPAATTAIGVRAGTPEAA